MTENTESSGHKTISSHNNDDPEGALMALEERSSKRRKTTHDIVRIGLLEHQFLQMLIFMMKAPASQPSASSQSLLSEQQVISFDQLFLNYGFADILMAIRNPIS